MKRTISLLLTAVLLLASVPVFTLTAAAQDTPAASASYVLYSEDFEGLSATLSKNELLQALGWYVPTAYQDADVADYRIVTEGENNALRVSTVQPAGLTLDSAVTIFGNDAMAIVREGDFVISYDLTYRAGTENVDGYSALVYNFNEKNGTSIEDGNAAAYGIAAVRACGTGMNGVVYPRSAASQYVSLEGAPNSARAVMTNRYLTAGDYPSVYGKIGGVEAADAVRTGTFALLDAKLSVRVEYVYETGIRVFVNNVLVSETLMADYNAEYNSHTWEDFLISNSGAAVSILTKYGVVADLDNIQIEAEEIGREGMLTGKLPELMITEIAACPKGGWAEYIEIYNASDEEIDLMDYALMSSNYVYESGEDSVLVDDRYDYYTKQKFGYVVPFSDILGQPVKSRTKFYLTEQDLKTYKGRYVFAETNTEVDAGTRYRQTEAKTYVSDPEGKFAAVYYTEGWNARYVQGNANYDYNTMLAPGQCALIYTMSDASENCWRYGINAGINDRIGISSDLCFRSYYADYGLDDPTVKVFASNAFNLGDAIQRHYFIGKTVGEDGSRLSTSVPIYAQRNQIVSYVEYCQPLVSGYVYGNESLMPTSGNFGKSGTHDSSTGWSASYVYGVDASSLPQRGTLYTFQNYAYSTSRSTIGCLAGYQQILLDAVRKKSDGTMADLSITEIVPRTLNLAGEDKNTFSAMELTNTSSHAVNLYRYALAATEEGTLAFRGRYFTRITEMRSGNPVLRGSYNGAYYYFAEEHLSNPERCILQPGETVVVWFITTDTYASYANDSDFGFDYFRQYWADNGSERLAMRKADGSYAVQVIAVDGVTSETYNADNMNDVFELSSASARVYGVVSAGIAASARSVRDDKGVKMLDIAPEEAQSVAFLSNAATYYQLKPVEVESADGTKYLANRLLRQIPANMGMRYIVGAAGMSRCSAMTRTMKTQQYVYTSANPIAPELDSGKTPRIVIRTNNALMQPKLGSLNGKEIYPFYQNYIQEDEAGNRTVFNPGALSVETLNGAAVATNGASAQLRFDVAIHAAEYAALVASCGRDNVNIGILVVPSDQLGSKTLNKSNFPNATVISGKVLYFEGDFVIVGGYLPVNAANYKTSYSAVGFIEYRLPGAASTVTLYSGVEAKGNVDAVARMALFDTEETSNAQYRFATDGGFSRYSAAVQAKLRSYISD